MAKNKDGFEPGQALTFDDLQSINRKIPESVPSGIDPVTRESIATMKKADVADLLEAHGVEDTEGSVGELRERLIAVMFVAD